IPDVEGWKFAPAPAARPNPVRAGNIPIPPKSHFFEHPQALVISPGALHAVIGYTLDDPRPAGVSRVVLVDLAKRKTMLNTRTSGKFVPLGVSDDGKQVLVRGDEANATLGTLELWTLDAAGVHRVASWPASNGADQG